MLTLHIGGLTTIILKVSRILKNIHDATFKIQEIYIVQMCSTQPVAMIKLNKMLYSSTSEKNILKPCDLCFVLFSLLVDRPSFFFFLPS